MNAVCPDCGKPWSEHRINLNEWDQPAYRCEPPDRWYDYLILPSVLVGVALFWVAVVIAISSALN